MLCVPTLKLLVAHCAVLVLPGPLSAEAAQPLIEFPPSVKVTVPVGLDPVTVAVNVTFAPTTDGLTELVNFVVEGVAPDALIWTENAAGGAEAALTRTHRPTA